MKNSDTQTHVKRIGPEIEINKDIILSLFCHLVKSKPKRKSKEKGVVKHIFTFLFKFFLFVLWIYLFIVSSCILKYFLYAREKLTRLSPRAT